MDPIDEKTRENVIDKELFSTEPNIEGTNNWIDENTLEFIPSNLMASGQDYKVTFSVDAIYQNTNLPDFDFNFHTLQQAVFPEFIGIQHTRSLFC